MERRKRILRDKWSHREIFTLLQNTQKTKAPVRKHSWWKNYSSYVTRSVGCDVALRRSERQRRSRIFFFATRISRTHHQPISRTLRLLCSTDGCGGSRLIYRTPAHCLRQSRERKRDRKINTKGKKPQHPHIKNKTRSFDTSNASSLSVLLKNLPTSP